MTYFQFVWTPPWPREPVRRGTEKSHYDPLWMRHIEAYRYPGSWRVLLREREELFREWQRERQISHSDFGVFYGLHVGRHDAVLRVLLREIRDPENELHEDWPDVLAWARENRAIAVVPGVATDADSPLSPPT